MEDNEIAPSSPHCWYCGIDESNRGEPLCLCKCADKFIHVYCLKERANTVNILNCIFCGARYPLERRPKSLLKMLLKVCFFMILLTILLIFTIAIIASVLFYYVEFPFIVQIIIVSIFLLHFYTYWPVDDIVDCSIRIYELYRQWYKSTYEWKLMRPSTVNNIEEYIIEE